MFSLHLYFDMYIMCLTSMLLHFCTAKREVIPKLYNCGVRIRTCSVSSFSNQINILHQYTITMQSTTANQVDGNFRSTSSMYVSVAYITHGNRGSLHGVMHKTCCFSREMMKQQRDLDPLYGTIPVHDKVFWSHSSSDR